MPVPIFTAGEVLTAANMNQIGLWKVASGSIALTTSPVNITGVFDDTKFSNYRVLFNVTNRSGTNAFYIRFIAGTTPTSVNYFSNGIGCAVASDAAFFFARVNDGSAIQTSATSGAAKYALDIYDPNKAVVTQFNGTGTTAGTGFTWGGQQDGAIAFTGVQVFLTTGTATLGYQVFGYRD
jgi:hypothetical protein